MNENKDRQELDEKIRDLLEDFTSSIRNLDANYKSNDEHYRSLYVQNGIYTANKIKSLCFKARDKWVLEQIEKKKYICMCSGFLSVKLYEIKRVFNEPTTGHEWELRL